MARTDLDLDANAGSPGCGVLRVAGGQAAPSDVTGAVDAVKERLRERPASRRATRPPRAAGGRRRAWQVRDMMTAEVITVDQARDRG
jgi:hypothetical protein